MVSRYATPGDTATENAIGAPVSSGAAATVAIGASPSSPNRATVGLPSASPASWKVRYPAWAPSSSEKL
jgi:hypothetical protein